MHVRSSLFVNAVRRHPAPSALVGLGACVLLSGCVAAPFRDAQVDPRSPIAAEVAKSVRPDAAYPTFAAFPATPKDIRPHAQYGVAARQVEKEGAALVAATDAGAWTLADTQGFAAQARIDAGPALPQAQPAETEAFAKDLKARATPPPPIKR